MSKLPSAGIRAPITARRPGRRTDAGGERDADSGRVLQRDPTPRVNRLRLRIQKGMLFPAVWAVRATAIPTRRDRLSNARAPRAPRRTDFQRRSEHRVGRAQIVPGTVIDAVDCEAARIQNQLVAGQPVALQGGCSLQDTAVEAHIQIQIEMADANLIGAGPRMDIHSFHDRIQTSPPPSDQRSEGEFQVNSAQLCKSRRKICWKQARMVENK